MCGAGEEPDVKASCLTKGGLHEMYRLTKQSVSTAFDMCMTLGVTGQNANADLNLLQVSHNTRFKFFVTPSKLMGIAPAKAQWDDRFCIIIGANVPFICRERPGDGE